MPPTSREPFAQWWKPLQKQLETPPKAPFAFLNAPHRAPNLYRRRFIAQSTPRGRAISKHCARIRTNSNACDLFFMVANEAI